MTCSPQFIQHQESSLYTVTYLPDATPNDIVIFCHPLFEEKKATHRFFVELGKALTTLGLGVVLFDYAGCGDSSGTFSDFCFSDWQDNLKHIQEHILDQYPDAMVNMLGVRLGALLALKHSIENKIDKLIIIDPVFEGKKYLDEILQQKLIREMVTYGQSKTNSLEELLANAEAGELIDLDGTPCSWKQYQSFCQQSIEDMTDYKFNELLLIQQSPKSNLVPQNQKFSDLCQSNNFFIQSQCLVQPPFWKAIDLADTSTVINSIKAYLQNHGKTSIV